MTKEKSSFHESLAKLLTAKLTEGYKAESARGSSLAIYNTIFETIVDLFQQVQAPLENDAVNWIAQQYYDGIQINQSSEGLDPNIFTKRVSLSDISTKELAFMSVLLTNTDFRYPVIAEIKKRS